jgi:hypothetical protein
VQYDVGQAPSSSKDPEAELAAAMAASQKLHVDDEPADTPKSVGSPEEKKTSGEVHLSREGVHGSEDTIYIDQEGILHQRD